MELKLENLNVPKEKVFFIIAAVLAVVVWGVVIVTIFGALIGLVVALFVWLANGLLVAHLRSSCIKIDSNQMPELYKTFLEVCAKFNTPSPELYILQAGGMLNAFAYSHSGRDFVVLFSDLVEDCDPAGDEIRFLLGHEIGHIKSKHIMKHIFLMPVIWLPLLGPAYHRACETSCDRYGAFSVNNMDGAIRAMLMLAGGKSISKVVDAAQFSNQSTEYRGFFVSWYELISGYPTLSQRVAHLVAIKNEAQTPVYHRNPFSYFFALFSIGEGSYQGGGVFIFFFIIVMLAAIAIPNLLRARMFANDQLARTELRSLATASETFAAQNEGKYPVSIQDLTNSNPPYLSLDRCGQQISGFAYSCEFSESGYRFAATPLKVMETGTTTFTIITGGVVTPDAEPAKFSTPITD